MKILEPFNGRIIAEKFVSQDVTEGGLAIPIELQKHTFKATIVRVSTDFVSDFTGHINVNTELKPGDVIHYEPFTAREIEFEDKKYIILQRKDIVAVERTKEHLMKGRSHGACSTGVL